MVLSVWGASLAYLLLACLVFYLMVELDFMFGESSLLMEWEMGENALMEVSFLLKMDWVWSAFLISVYWISAFVSMYSAFYMGEGEFSKRCLHLIHIFVFFMSLLISMPSFLALMVGWDGLGMSSFLLIIQYQNSQALSGGMFAAVTNRLGDVCFLLAISLYSSMMSYSSMGGLVFVSGVMLSFWIVLGSVTKSCQVPFCAWLPEAMVAPTPISTLVHSSTLVTAGVYVLFRFSCFIDESLMEALSMVAMLTILLASSNALVESDLKKVVALSTLGQVGVMVFLIGVGSPSVSMFHLLIHAFLKALMFMCVGSIIFYFGDQDFRSVGGVWLKLPLTSCLLVFSSMSLMGVPFLSGFYSKEMIISYFVCKNVGVVKSLLLLFSLVLTGLYSFRVIMLVFQGSGNLVSLSLKQENLYLLLPHLFMANGVISAGVGMQAFFCYWEDFSSGLVSWGVVYGIVLEMMLVSLSLWCFKELMGKSQNYSFLKNFFGSMWFLKPLSGNALSSKILVFLSQVVCLVEMGMVRKYFFEKGIKKIFFGSSSQVWSSNFGLLGGALLYCLCFMFVLFSS